MSRLSFFFIFALMFSLRVNAANTPRHVHLEWDADNEAATYEIEIGHQGTKKLALRRTGLKTSEWDGDFRPGKYWMRLRGRDDRDLAGGWSDQIEFEVKVPAPDLISPKPNETLASLTPQAPVTLKWEPIVDIRTYVVNVYDKNKTVVWTTSTAKTSLAAPLLTAAAYTWSVQAIDEHGNKSDVPEVKPSFIAQGPATYQPVLKTPESEYVRQVELATALPDQATAKISIERFDDKTQQWTKVTTGQMHKGARIPFQAKLPGGHYRVTAVCEEPLRAPSSVESVSFTAIDGPRTQKVESRALIRQSIERTNTWFVTGAYVLSTVNYYATVLESNRSARLGAVSSGVNLGLGRFWKESPYGLYIGTEGDSLKVSGHVYSSFDLEASALYKISLQRESELRFKLGLFDHGQPQATSLGSNPSTDTQLKNSTQLGPQAGVEYWYSFSPKFAMQLSAIARSNLAGSAAQGGSIQPTLSYRAGLLGGYRFNKNLTSLAGYSYREENLKTAATNTSIAVSGTDTVEVHGHYLQLAVEYDY